MEARIFAVVALCLGLIIGWIDVHYYYGWRGWHAAWTHWAFALTLAHFAASLVGFHNALHSIALACTLSVNFGFWLFLFPMRYRNGNASFGQLTGASVAKHGGSLLWLFGELFTNRCNVEPLTTYCALPILACSGSYVLFSIHQHKTTGTWPYGRFFALSPVRLAFVVAPLVLYWAFARALRQMFPQCHSSTGNTWCPSCRVHGWFPPAALCAMPIYFAARYLLDLDVKWQKLAVPADESTHSLLSTEAAKPCGQPSNVPSLRSGVNQSEQLPGPIVRRVDHVSCNPHLQHVNVAGLPVVETAHVVSTAREQLDGADVEESVITPTVVIEPTNLEDKDRFTEALAALDASKPGMTAITNDERLELYQFYKQGTVGESSQGTKPGYFDVVGQAKYTAWTSVSGLDQGEAKDRYAETVHRLIKKYIT